AAGPRVACEDAGVAPGEAQRSLRQALDGAVGIVVEAALLVAPAQAADPPVAVAALERAQQVAEGRLTLATDDEVDAEFRRCPGVGSETRIVAADDDAGGGAARPHEPDEPEGRAALGRHHPQADRGRLTPLH